jgi:hypothetical protein
VITLLCESYFVMYKDYDIFPRSSRRVRRSFPVLRSLGRGGSEEGSLERRGIESMIFGSPKTSGRTESHALAFKIVSPILKKTYSYLLHAEREC